VTGSPLNPPPLKVAEGGGSVDAPLAGQLSNGEVRAVLVGQFGALVGGEPPLALSSGLLPGRVCVRSRWVKVQCE